MMVLRRAFLQLRPAAAPFPQAGLRAAAFPAAGQLQTFGRSFAKATVEEPSGELAIHDPTSHPVKDTNPIRVGHIKRYQEFNKLKINPETVPGRLAVQSDVPEYLIQRGKVRIIRRSNFVGQSHKNHNLWEIEFLIRGSSRLTEVHREPLMGWVASSDPYLHLHGEMNFKTKEAAIEYCEEMGFEYEVVPFNERKRPVKSYASNFRSSLYVPKAEED